MTIFILGGGPAGLAVADGLAGAGGDDFVVIERMASLGGLAQTVTWQGVGDHDLGPHKIFTIDRELMARVEALLPAGDWLTREKSSAIFLNGHFLPYPPSPFSLANVFGLGAFVAMTFGYGIALLRSMLAPVRAATFEEDLIARVGAPLYRRLFAPIASKLWDAPARLDVKLSQARVQTPKLGEVLLRLLKLNKSSGFEALTFRYPRGGLQRLWRAIEARTAGRGSYLTGQSVSGIQVESGRIVGLQLHSADGGESRLAVGPGDYVVSTLPLGPTLEQLRGTVSERAIASARDVVALNDLLLVFLHVDKSSLIEKSWIFIPDPSIAFHRLSEQESFDPAMTPDGSIVCCEIMSNHLREMAALSDQELIDRSLKGLADMGIGGFTLRGSRVIRLPKSYPVFRPGYEAALKAILAELDGLENFKTIGRQGAFNYIGTLDAMDIGYGFARWLPRRDQAPWSEERRRTEHYPILD